MNIVKLKKSYLKLLPDELLVKLGAKRGSSVFPQHVYFSREDYKVLSDNIKELVGKQFHGYNKNFKANVVGWEMLNYGPNRLLQDAIRPGYILIDVEAIEKEV